MENGLWICRVNKVESNKWARHILISSFFFTSNFKKSIESSDMSKRHHKVMLIDVDNINQGKAHKLVRNIL